MARTLDRERRAVAIRTRSSVRTSAHTKPRTSDTRPRAISAAAAVALLEALEARFSSPEVPDPPGISSLNTDNFGHVLRKSWTGAADVLVSVWNAVLLALACVVAPDRNLNPLARIRATLIACTVVLTIVAIAPFVGGEIDLTKLLPGNDTVAGRPRVVVISGRLVNQGDAPALNLEVTRPSYRLIGKLANGEGIPAPAPDFTVQYEWNDRDRVHRETRSFRIGTDAAAIGSGAGQGRVDNSAQRGLAARSVATPGFTTPYEIGGAVGESGSIPPGLAASYDPVSHLLTVSASRRSEVRVDGFLLRPISRTDMNGAEYRYAHANILVLGQDLKSGETTTFEVVFTKPQDYYSIPIYIREPGKPAAYFTFAVATKAES